MHRRLQFAAIVVASLLGTLLACPVSALAVGSYSVTVTDASQLRWTSVAPTNRAWTPLPAGIETSMGTISAGSSADVELDMPDPSLSVAGGTLSGTYMTRTAWMFAEVRVLEHNVPGRNVFSAIDATSFTASLGPGYAIRVGLDDESTRDEAAPLGWNSISVTSLTLDLTDSQPPVLRLLSQPLDHWNTGDCVSIDVGATDTGSGVAHMSLVPDVAAAPQRSWQVQEPASALQPGASYAAVGECVPLADLVQGPNTVTVSATDAAGRSTSQPLTVLVDTNAPDVSTTLANDASFDAAPTSFAFDVRDATSGVAHVTAAVDGVGQATNIDGEHYIWSAPGSALALGTHTLHVTATDVAGNTTVVDRAFTVVDSTAPTIVAAPPSVEADGYAVVTAHASDAQSGIDASTWSLSVDGLTQVPTPLDGGVAARIGPLAIGAHSARVRVADAMGNVATLVVPIEIPDVGSGPRAAALGGATGFAIRAESAGSPMPYGRTVRYLATAVAQGHPLAGHRVLVTERATGTKQTVLTDARGVAEVAIVARRSTALTFTVEGASLRAKTIKLSVAPAMTLAAASTRATVGHAVRITGRIAPGNGIPGVQLQAAVGGHWYPLHRTVHVVRGSFTTTVSSGVVGTFSVRVVTVATSRFAAGRSAPVKLHVGRSSQPPTVRTRRR